MSLIPFPYNEISAIISAADNAVKTLETRYTQRQANKIMREKQLSIMQVALDKIEAELRIRATGDLVCIAFDELNRTATRFSTAVQSDPALARVCQQMLQWQAQLFMRTIEAFNHGTIVSPQNFLT